MYQKIELGNGIVVDYMCVLDRIASKQEQEKMNLKRIIPDWETIKYVNTDGTIKDIGKIKNIKLLCNFNNNLTSSYMAGMNETIIGFNVYRYDLRKDKIYKVCKLSKGATSVIDYMVSNNNSYKWYVIPYLEYNIGETMMSNNINVALYGWSITSLKQVDENVFIADEVWDLGLDMKSGGYTQNLDKTVFQNFTEFPKVSIGNKQYLSTSLSFLLGSIDPLTGTYVDNIDKFEKWNKFVMSSNHYLLKDLKGNLLTVQIMANSSSFIDSTINQVTTVNIDIIEIKNSEHISVFKEL